jgi:hypothetical protein
LVTWIKPKRHLFSDACFPAAGALSTCVAPYNLGRSEEKPRRVRGGLLQVEQDLLRVEKNTPMYKEYVKLLRESEETADRLLRLERLLLAVAQSLGCKDLRGLSI